MVNIIMQLQLFCAFGTAQFNLSYLLCLWALTMKAV